MKSFATEYAVMAYEVVTIMVIVLFVGVFGSKYYEKISVCNTKVFYWQVTLLGATIMLSHWFYLVGNFPALVFAQTAFHLMTLSLLFYLSKKFERALPKMRYERQKKIALWCEIAAWAFEISAILATFTWLCLYM